MLTTLCTQILLVVLYRLTLHPLASYPGPFLAKLTSLYDTYHCFKKDRHHEQLRLHAKYGPIVRYGPNYLLFNTASGAADIYTHAKTAGITKGDGQKYYHDDGIATLNVIDPEVHGFRRRVMAQSFSDQSLRGMMPIVVDKVDKWCKKLGEDAKDGAWSSAKDMSDWSTYLTFDILGELCFGQSFNTLESDANRDLSPIAVRVLWLYHVVSMSFLYTFLFPASLCPNACIADIAR
jgi:cytochrome P450